MFLSSFLIMYIMILCEGMETQKKMFILEPEICTVLVRALVCSLHYLQLLPLLLPPKFILFINYFESAHINSRLIQPIHT